ncbi:MAG: CHASE2 domain-containing protein [Treponema sp.]|nr:CHASE2 domain-containing protein [Treponema sp.]
MEKKRENVFLKKSARRILVLAVSLFWIVLTAFGLLQKFDYRLYDLLLGLHSAPPSRPELLFVEVDNQSLEAMGPWPWTRDKLADALLRMKELGAQTAVFDIEYLSPSNLGVAPDAAEKLASAFAAEKNDIADLVGELTGAVTSGFVTKKELPAMADEMIDSYINPGIDALLASVQKSVYRDNDAFFAGALQFFGNSWLTINIVDIETKNSAEDEAYVVNRFLLDNVEDPDDRIRESNLYYALDQGNDLGFAPTLPLFMRHASGAGFTNIVLDSDGSRRRVELLHKHGTGDEARYVGQLTFAPLLEICSPEKIVRSRSGIKLVQALLPGDTARRDVTIPLDSHGRMLINWLHREFKDSFRHESVFFLYQLEQMEKNIVAYLSALDGFSLWDADGKTMDYSSEVHGLAAYYDQLCAFRESLLDACQGYDVSGEAVGGALTAEDYKEYFAARAAFFDGVSAFLAAGHDKLIAARLAEMSAELGEEQASSLGAEIAEIFSGLSHESGLYAETFAELSESYRGSFCIIGETASSTTDLGNTPFNRAYPNVGTHANVYNTIVQQDFIRPLHWLPFSLIVLALAFAAALRSEKGATLRYNTASLVVAVLAIAFPPLAMMFFAVYIPAITPGAIAVSAALAVMLLNFLASDKDKRFLRNAFSTYLAPSVVDQIVKNPEKLKLGGDEKVMTALFSDIRSFSTFSEKVTPTELVNILNDYLGAMSDRILEAEGTIDKYIGDAIVSFFGAPVDLENHAYSACYAAVRMKQAEKAYNDVHFTNGDIPMKLETRIGINSGSMVVGNMGTNAKFNYTMMGDNVNLASRLEGVNKDYASWILVSEATWSLAESGSCKGKLVFRKLDRVRVVGKEVSVQVYNVIGIRSEMTQAQIEAAEVFDSASDAYLAGDFEKALSLYEKAQSLAAPEDGTPAIFVQRCKDFIAEGKHGPWDGVYVMKDKGHD